MKNKKLFQIMFSNCILVDCPDWECVVRTSLGILIYPKSFSWGKGFGIVNIRSPADPMFFSVFYVQVSLFYGFMYRFEQFSFVP